MNSYTPILIFDFPGGSDGKSVCLQCRRPRFDPWVGKIPWRRKWHPTPVLLPGKSHGRRSLVGYSPWGRKESDTTERLHFHPYFYLLIFIFDCAGPLLLCGLFSSCGKWGYSVAAAQTSHRSGFSCCGAWALGHVGFSSCSSQALEDRLNSCGTQT